MFVCLLVCWSAFYRRHDICPLCGAASEYSESCQAIAGGGASACTARARARMPYNLLLNEKPVALMPFKTKPYARAHAVVYVTAEIFKRKGKRKPTCHFPSSVYSLPSLGVFTFRIVLNRILHKSSFLAPMESRRTRRPTFTAEERLERRREQDRRRHAERRAGEIREQTQARRDVDRLRSSHLETQQLLDDLQRIQS